MDVLGKDLPKYYHLINFKELPLSELNYLTSIQGPYPLIWERMKNSWESAQDFFKAQSYFYERNPDHKGPRYSFSKEV